MRAEGLGTTPRSGGRPDDTLLYGALFAAAVGAFCLSQIIGRRLGLVSELVAVAGDATCGWSWLLVRALFQPARPRRELWPLGLVLILVASGAVLRWSGASAGPLPRMVGNLGELVSSALLLLAAIEPLKGLNSSLNRGEQGFRLTFMAGYLASLAIAVIWVSGAPAGELTAQERMAIRTACAIFSLLGMGAAIWYRHRHPLSVTRPERQRDRTSDANGLAPALRQLMVQDGLYTRQSLKVADVARRLGEPDYKITACITGPLGFRNFNQMANHFRITEAKRQLADPAYEHLPILTIAYDCGFGSIGPFNRAFKLETGLTPQQFRKASSVPG
ncbi:helix-turn-helix domain-containing protein [Caulobacter henricii]|uniref:AraC family transcriptional regulator n=1 Tax=Caulobacter henricii TaxID=69395 RepID=A0A0P0P3F5_9CAUL|nr:AraC family transcriptional regulator [Caulobacter henricii]ALL15080.1 AraC family transcriptional regulator [Caulobacter henricii]